MEHPILSELKEKIEELKAKIEEPDFDNDEAQNDFQDMVNLFEEIEHELEDDTKKECLRDIKEIKDDIDPYDAEGERRHMFDMDNDDFDEDSAYDDKIQD